MTCLEIVRLKAKSQQKVVTLLHIVHYGIQYLKLNKNVFLYQFVAKITVSSNLSAVKIHSTLIRENMGFIRFI